MHAGRPRKAKLGEFGLDGVIYIVFAEFAGDTNGVLDRVGVRSSVTHDRDSLDAEQRRPSELRVIEPALEFIKSVLRKNGADSRRQGFLQFAFEHGAERLDQSFAEFQRDIANESIAHND